MASINPKEQYWRFKPFAEFQASFGKGDPDIKLTFTEGYVYGEGDTVTLLAKLDEDAAASKGFKNDGNFKTVAWTFHNTATRKVYGKELPTTRLEKYCYSKLKEYAGKYISGVIYIGFGIAFDKYEGGLDSAIDMAVEFAIKEISATFDVPSVSASSGSNKGTFTPKETETERLKAKMDFVIGSLSQLKYWDKDAPKLDDIAVGMLLMPEDELPYSVFILWLSMNLAGAPVSVEDAKAIAGLVPNKKR